MQQGYISIYAYMCILYTYHIHVKIRSSYDLYIKKTYFLNYCKYRSGLERWLNHQSDCLANVRIWVWIPNTHVKVMHGRHPSNPRIEGGGRNRRVLGACWPASLVQKLTWSTIEQHIQTLTSVLMLISFPKWKQSTRQAHKYRAFYWDLLSQGFSGYST